MKENTARIHVDGWGPLYLSHVTHRAVRSLSDGAFRVWATLNAHAGCRSTRVVIGVDRLGQLCGHSHRTIQRHLSTLQRVKLIQRQARYGKRGQELRRGYELLEPQSVRGGVTAVSPLIDDPIPTETIPTEPPLTPPSRGGDLPSLSVPRLELLPDPLVALFEQALLQKEPEAYTALETKGPIPEKLGDLLWLVLSDPVDPEVMDWARALAKEGGFSGRERSSRTGLKEAAVNVRSMFWEARSLAHLETCLTEG
jgi:hypothetical protein